MLKALKTAGEMERQGQEGCPGGGSRARLPLTAQGLVSRSRFGTGSRVQRFSSEGWPHPISVSGRGPPVRGGRARGG